MGRLTLEISQELEESLEDRVEETGLSKSEITRGALVERLGI